MVARAGHPLPSSLQLTGDWPGLEKRSSREWQALAGIGEKRGQQLAGFFAADEVKALAAELALAGINGFQSSSEPIKQ